MENKIGLEFILQLSGMQHQELAEKLGIKKQNINLWIKGAQKIPKKHLPTLTKIFGLPEELFLKQLSEVDRLSIQKMVLSKEIKESTVQIPTTQYDETRGKWVSIEATYYNGNAVESERLIDVKIEGLKVLEMIKQDIFDSSKSKDADDYIGRVSSAIELYMLLNSVKKNASISDDTIEKVLKCLRDFSELEINESVVDDVTEEEANDFDFEQEIINVLLLNKKIDMFKQKELLALYKSLE